MDSLDKTKISVIEASYNNIGDSFKDILNTLDKINSKGGDISTLDAMSLQQSSFQYSFNLEMFTKIASKSATAINDVMKAQ